MVESKELIKKKVEQQLQSNTQVEASNVSVEVADDGGKVILEGSVPYLSAKQAVTEVTKRVFGVREVENNLEVVHVEPFSSYADENLEADVREALFLSSVLQEDNIDVEVREGVVTLLGSVSDYWKKSRALELATQVRGVKNVVDELAVVPTRGSTDEQIALDVLATLDRDISADIDQIDVHVDNGRVVFDGVVSSWIAKNAAKRAAESTAGVKDIVDNLSIRY
ncbi:BON domain-containing protein [candidate division WWE3 bacterium]|nr:BON domain-containing protein [candidate division WWE3 bacterium]